jgi:cyanophycinase-like exopeptidase
MGGVVMRAVLYRALNCGWGLGRALGLVGLGLLATDAALAQDSKLKIYTVGTPAVGLPCEIPAPTAVLMGGGRDVSRAYAWMIRKANCGVDMPEHPGNVVVLRADGDGAYDRYIYKQGVVAAVQTLRVPDAASANDPRLTQIIQNAAVIWIAGGDQSIYYNQWKGSLLASLVQTQIQSRKIPFGGTSAGLMVLGNFVHVGAPRYDLSSAEALADPYNREMKLKRDFWSASQIIGKAPLPVLLNTITDSHFSARDRMGRSLAFIARNLADGWLGGLSPEQIQSEHAIAVDEQTALLVEQTPSGHYEAAIVSNGAVVGAAYLMNPSSAPLCSADGQPLSRSCGGPFTLTATQVHRLSSSGGPHTPFLFDLSTWTPTAAAGDDHYLAYTLDVISGVVTSSQPGGGIY